jgi:hypothetical protein
MPYASKWRLFVDNLTLKMKVLHPSKCSENIYPVSQRNIPEDFNFQQRGCENLSIAKPYSPKLRFSARSYKVCEECTALID